LNILDKKFNSQKFKGDFMRGGARPGSGPKKGTKYKPRASKGKGKPAVEPKTKKPEVPQDIQDEAALQNMTPLDYMLKVMRDTAGAGKFSPGAPPLKLVK
jgi:hypothetical protein